MSVARLFSRSVLMLLAIGLLMSSGCSSSKPSTKAITATSQVDEGYARAKKMYDKENYSEAAIVLESLLFTSRATALEDDVLFLLAQSYYRSGQYLLAAEMFTKLQQQITSTPFARTSQFLLAKSYEKLSPHFELDQQFTRKAIEQFAVYMDLYPMVDSSKVASDVETYRELLKINPGNETYKQNLATATTQFARIDTLRYAEKAITELREKLAKNTFFIARQYIQLGKYKAAGIFYDEVIKLYPETSYVKQAWAGKIDVLIKRKKWFDAGQALDQYLQLSPDKEKEMRGTREKIKQNLKN
jgi:outer membrane protein assembly factor BamD